MPNFQSYYPQGVYMPPQQYQQPMYMQPQQYQQPVMISGRLVSSKEEALSVPADYGTGFSVMPDFAHGTVYAKIVNKDTGAADVQTFRRVTDEAPAQQESRMDALERKVDAILQMLQGVPTGKHVKEADADV